MISNGGAPNQEMIDAGTFDYIVTGAGSAGCAVAARLSEDGRYRVLLLEAGGRDSYWWIHVPIGYAKLFTDAGHNWLYSSDPEPGLNGRQINQPRGKVKGGSSTTSTERSRSSARSAPSAP